MEFGSIVFNDNVSFEISDFVNERVQKLRLKEKEQISGVFMVNIEQTPHPFLCSCY